MKKQTSLIMLVVFTLLSNIVQSRTLHVGTEQTYSTLQEAAAVALPGDAILIHNGIYTQRENISSLNGEADNPIIIYAEEEGKVIYTGQSEAWHLSSCSNIFIYGFVFEKQTSNGVNIDDSGNFDQSTHHIIIKNCIFRNMDASGNNDMLKLSGLDDFTIENCLFQNGSKGGSGIDMVGCHNGIFIKNTFENMGSNSIQVKGGSQFITIKQNTFIDGGQRSLNLGGSTGLQYFRPLDATFEAADIDVYSNIFIRSWTPIGFVGSVRVRVFNNTFYKPENWVFRILQETVDTSRFLACGDNEFSNNIIYFGNSIHRIVNVGANTRPESFTISNNLWYHFEDDNFSAPDLPVTETNATLQQDPLFIDPDNSNFDLQANSPAIAKGKILLVPKLDFKDRYFQDTCSIGAFEHDGIYKDFTEGIGTMWYYSLNGDGGFQTLECKEKIIQNGRELMNVEHYINIGDVAGVIGNYLLFTNDNQVIFKLEYDDSFYPLYDFTLKKDDEFISNLFDTSPFNTRIDSINFEYISGKVRKVLNTSPRILLDLGHDQGYFGNKGKIIEGINSVKSFMFGNFYEEDYYFHDSLRCFSYYNDKGVNNIEKFVNYPCDSLTVGTIKLTLTPIEIYPNPASDYINIEFYNDISADIEIFDLTGKKVLAKQAIVETTTRFDISELKEGIYFIKFVGKNINQSEKLLIIRK